MSLWTEVMGKCTIHNMVAKKNKEKIDDGSPSGGDTCTFDFGVTTWPRNACDRSIDHSSTIESIHCPDTVTLNARLSRICILFAESTKLFVFVQHRRPWLHTRSQILCLICRQKIPTASINSITTIIDMGEWKRNVGRLLNAYCKYIIGGIEYNLLGPLFICHHAINPATIYTASQWILNNP